MNNKFITFAVIIVIAYFLFTKKKVQDMVTGTDEPDAPAPPASSGSSGQLSFDGSVVQNATSANTGINGTQNYDVNSGIGEQAVNTQIQVITQTPSLDADVKDDANIIDIFETVDPVQVQTILENSAIKGASDYTSLPIVPEVVNSNYKKQIESLIDYTANFPQNYSTLGKDSALKKLQQLMDFRSTASFHLLSDIDLVIDSSRGYGECKGLLWGKKRKEECRGNQYHELAEDVNEVAEAMLINLGKYELAVKNKAIARLKNTGWKFIGY